jgi:multiple sugar transport system substrate-binding protein
MRLKRITSAVAVSLVAASLAGCGGNEETSGGAAEGVTLTYWASNQGTSLENDQEVLKPQLDAFTAATGIEVDVEVVPWSDLLNRILAPTCSTSATPGRPRCRPPARSSPSTTPP